MRVLLIHELSTFHSWLQKTVALKMVQMWQPAQALLEQQEQEQLKQLLELVLLQGLRLAKKNKWGAYRC